MTDETWQGVLRILAAEQEVTKRKLLDKKGIKSRQRKRRKLTKFIPNRDWVVGNGGGD